MQVEINQLTEKIREIESSDGFKTAMDALSEGIANGDTDGAIAAYNKWRDESGYGEMFEKRDDLRKEYGKLQEEAAKLRKQEAFDEEQKAIEESGLSEADYFRKQAVKEFGYTPFFYDAGYITPNGKMLNFSGEKGAHYGSRGQDHRAIGTIYANVDGSHAMIKFMGEGNIRIMPESPGIDISSMAEPTKEQYATIRKFVREYAGKEYFNVDITDAEGMTIGNYQYEGRVNAERVVNDIKYFFENGTTREQSSISQFLQRRDTTTIHDVVGETERLKAENEKLKADFEALKERLALEKKVTHGNYFNENQLDMVAKHLLNESNSTYAKADLIEKLRDVYSYIAQNGKYRDEGGPSWDGVYSRSYDIATAMLKEKRAEVEVDEYAKGFLRDMKKMRISLNESQIAEAKHRFGDNYHRAFFGKVILAKDGIPLDNAWGELSNLYPDVFDADINDADQVSALFDGIAAMREASEVMIEYNAEEQARWLATEIYNKYWTVSTIKTTADKYDKKIRLINLEHRNRITELRNAYNDRLKEQHKTDKAKFTELASKIRADRDVKIAEAKEHGREKLAQYRENAERKTHIQRITQNALTLNEWLVKNSKDKHIPESMKAPVTALINAIDFSSKRLIDKGIPTKKDISLAKALSKVHKMMSDAVEGKSELADTLGAELAGGEFVKDMQKLVESVTEIVLEKSADNDLILNNMSLEDLQNLDTLVRVVKHSVSKANKLHAVQFSAGAVALATQSEKELDSRAKMIKEAKDGKRKKHFDTLKSKTMWNNTNPYYAFKHFGPAAQALFRGMQDGQDKLAFLSKEVIDFAEATYSAKELKKWTKQYFDFKVAQPNGKVAKFSMNVPQIMSLYCVAKQEDALRHILHGDVDGNGGGITLVETKETDAVLTNIMLTEADLNNIIKKLDGYDNGRAKKVADTLQEYMCRRGAQLGNEITMKRWGIKSFGITNYFPIKVSKGTVKSKNDTPGVQGNSLLELLNMSFTKSRNEFAQNSIEVGDIFDVFSSHMSDMIRYNALSLPILDMYKWMNYRGTDAFGKEHSVETSVRNTFGDHAWNYINNFMKDANGSTKSQKRDNWAVKFFKNAKVAKVANSLSVIALQPTSYIRAGAVMDNKYLLKAFLHKPKTSHAEKYCGIALWKSLGYYDTDITKGITEQIKHDTDVRGWLVEKSLKGAEKADKATWGVLWNACELEIRDTRKDLKVGSKEFFEAVGLRLRDVIYATQVVDSVMTRSNLMRSTDTFDKVLTTFMSEPTLSLNLATDAFISAQLAKRSGEKVDKKYIRKSITAYVVTNVVASAVQSAMNALRDTDDDEEKDEEYWIKLFMTNFALNSSFFNKLPYWNQIFSLLQGFDANRVDVDWMSKLVKSGEEIVKLTNGKGSAWRLTKYLTGALSDASGIAAYNALRDIVAVLDMFDEDLID